MIFPENQVRNFYVAKAIKVGSASMSAIGDAKAHQKNGKYWLEYVDANGKTITSDIIRIKNIRDIRISKPEGFNGRVWAITVDTTNLTNGSTCMLYFDLGNVFGFGEGEKFYYSYPVYFKTGMTAGDILQKFEDIISNVLKYNKVMASVFESATYDGTDSALYLKEADQDYDGLLGYYPHSVNVKISANAVDANGAVLDYAEIVTDKEVANYPTFSATETYAAGDRVTYSSAAYEFTSAHSAGAWTGSDATAIYSNIPTAHSKTNSYKVAAMERFFSKVRADLYGYMGYPDVNPSTMILPDADANSYYILDIKYYTQLSGVNNQNSEKEMSIACSNFSNLFKLVKDNTASYEVTLTTDNAGNAPADNKSNVYSVNN